MIQLPNVAFYGPPGAGKSTAAKFLVEAAGYAQVSAFGYHPGGGRDIATRIWGPDAAYDREKLDVLAHLREYDPEIWTRPFWREVERVTEDGAWVVTDDLRTAEEYHKLRAAGWLLIRIEAGEETRIERLQHSGKFQNIEQLRAPLQHYLDDAELFPPDYLLDSEQSKSETQQVLADILNLERRKRA
jgi:hypothetical protein